MANRGRGMQAEEYRMYFRGEEYCGWPGEPVFHASHAYASQLEKTESGVVSSWLRCPGHPVGASTVEIEAFLNG